MRYELNERKMNKREQKKGENQPNANYTINIYKQAETYRSSSTFEDWEISSLNLMLCRLLRMVKDSDTTNTWPMLIEFHMLQWRKQLQLDAR